MASTIYGVPYDEVIKAQRKVGKVAILGLGFGMGHLRFQQTVKDWTGISVPQLEAKTIVNAYRSKYSKVKGLWRYMEAAMEGRFGPFEQHGEFTTCKMPSGRKLWYKDVQNINGQLTYMTLNSQSRKWERTKTWGGKIVENIVQAVARDIMAYAMVALEDHGYRVVMTVHDEIACEVHEDFGSLEEMIEIMVKRPSWALKCPIEAEGWEDVRYQK